MSDPGMTVPDAFGIGTVVCKCGGLRMTIGPGAFPLPLASLCTNCGQYLECVPPGATHVEPPTIGE